MRFMIYLQRGAANGVVSLAPHSGSSDLHPSQLNDILRLGGRIDLDHSKGRADTKGAVQNINPKNNWFPLSKRGDDL